MIPRLHSLLGLIVVLFVLSIGFRITRWTGWWPAAAISAALMLVVIVCFALAMAPEATKYAITFAGIGLVTFSLLACWILHTREQARSAQCVDNLRRVGLGAHEQRTLGIDLPLHGPGDPAYFHSRQVYPARRER
jgi:hypothetical protein